MTAQPEIAGHPDLFRISLSLPAHLSDADIVHVETVFSELLDSVATSHLRVLDQNWLLEALFEFEPDRAVVMSLLEQPLQALGAADAPLEISPLEARDWLAENRAAFPPLLIGRVWIHGSHVKTRPPAASKPLLVEAAQAFGSGTHPTTEGCVRALQMIASARPIAPRTVLDMGCGSAILAMAAQRLWPRAQIMAADNDPVAVRVAAGNARLNNIAKRQMRCVVSAGFAGRAVRCNGPYDIVLANILAGPLRRMAPQLVPHLAPDGWIILSGILNEQATSVERAYAANGARCWTMMQIGEWTTIVMRRAAIGTMPRLWHGRNLG